MACVTFAGPVTTLDVEDPTTELYLCRFWRRVKMTSSDNVIIFLLSNLDFAVFGAVLGLFWRFIFGVAT
ncbi:MAG: hypothetical protein ABI298_04110 [Acidimicrobiales bacterium]